MLFGKKRRPVLAAIFGQKPKPALDEVPSTLHPVAHEERGALMEAWRTDPIEESPSMRNEAPASFVSSQQILGILERLNGHVILAKRRGIQPSRWVDECMSELIQGVEIALNEGWTEFVEALVDAGRILQTYANSGRAEECLPFLSEGHEILLLLASDLSSGLVRPGLMRKWRTHYDAAVANVSELGIQLARDDDETPPQETAKPVSVSASAITPFPTEHTRKTARQIQNESSVDEVTPLNTDSEPELEAMPAEPSRMDHAEPVEVALETPAADGEAESELASETKPEPARKRQGGRKSKSDSAATTDVFPFEAFQPSLFDTNVHAEEETDVPDIALAPQEKANLDTQKEVAPALDALCEALATIESDPNGDVTAALSMLEHKCKYLGLLADEHDRTGAVELCRVLHKMIEHAMAQPTSRTDKFFELTYAFCGAYVDAGNDPNDSATIAWCTECESLMTSWTVSREIEDQIPQAEVSEMPQSLDTREPVATTEFSDVSDQSDSSDLPDSSDAPESLPALVQGSEPDSPERLLANAQNAVARGEVASAKSLALQAVAGIARLEAAQAQAQLHELEIHLRRSSETAEETRTTLQRAEHAVREAAAKVSDAQSELVSRRGATAEALSIHAQIDARIKELDEEIQRLQSRRTEEALRLEQMHINCEATKGRELECEDLLTSTKKVEHDTRVTLENARQEVKALDRKRAEVEAAVERARELLLEKRVSCEEIESALVQLGSGKSAAASVSEDLLC